MNKIYTLLSILLASFSGNTQVTANCIGSTTVYLDNTGGFTIQDSDLDNGSTTSNNSLTFSASQTTFTCAEVTDVDAANSLIISAVYDGPLPGGSPKGVELYVINDITDLSSYGIGSANNGGGTDGEEFTFPADAVSAGTYIYITNSSAQFQSWFGFATTYTSGSMAINGDDAIELFHNATVIDVFGDINTDGTGQTWEYLDGWAKRNDLQVLNNGTFNDANWTFSGINVLDGETDNATATTPVPVGVFTTPSDLGTTVTLTVTDDMMLTDVCTSQIIILDTLAPTISCIGGTPTFNLDATTGIFVLTTADLDNGSTDNCSTINLSITNPTYNCNTVGLNSVTLYGTDAYGNVDSCTMDIMIDASNYLSVNVTTSNDITCFGGNDGDFTVSSTNGSTYSIDNGVTYGSMITWNNQLAGDYTIIAQSADGCTASTTVTLSQPDSITASFTVINPICLNDSIGEIDMTVSGGTGSLTYIWNTVPSQMTEDLTNLTGGNYSVSISDVNNCTVTADTTLTTGFDIDLSYTVSSNTITSNYPFGTFEWMDCSDNSIIMNETNYSYTAPQNGSYAAIISMLGCQDTTECIEITGVGFDENETIDFNIYPNPSNGNYTIDFNGTNNTIRITDINGKLIYSELVTASQLTIDLSEFDNGIYYINIKSDDTTLTKTISLIK